MSQPDARPASTVEGRGALVVGASSDIGVAVARALTSNGDRVIGVSLESREDPAFVDTLVADCTDSTSLDLSWAVGEFGA